MVPLKAVALPAAAWVAFSVVWLAASALGIPRDFDGRTMTLTEATAIASHADAARLLRSGADPNAPARLRAHLVRNNETTMTPLEAATGAIRTGPVQMLVDHGAKIDETNYPVLWCAARARNNEDMIRFLDSQRPYKPVIDCRAVRPVW
jgi:ankyrin repeat protein